MMFEDRTPPSPRVPAQRSPAGLGRRAHRLWRWAASEFDLEPHERELLEEACRTLDRLDECRAAVATDGTMIDGSRGQRVAHPLLSEERMQRQLLARLLAGLGMPSDVDDTIAAARFGRRGAEARWRGLGRRTA